MKLLNCFRTVNAATAEKYRLDAATRERIQREVQRIERMNPDIAPEAAHIAAVDEVIGGLMAQTEVEIERVVKAMEAKPETRAEAQDAPQKEPEYINSVAVKSVDGTIRKGQIHALIEGAMDEGAVHGYTTSAGRFVTREEAEKLPRGRIPMRVRGDIAASEIDDPFRRETYLEQELKTAGPDDIEGLRRELDDARKEIKAAGFEKRGDIYVFTNANATNTETRAEAPGRGEGAVETSEKPAEEAQLDVPALLASLKAKLKAQERSGGPVDDRIVSQIAQIERELAKDAKEKNPLENTPPGGWTDADRVPVDKEKIERGDWVEYTDSYGKKQIGKVDSVWKVGRIIPGQGATAPRTEFSMVNAAGEAIISPAQDSPMFRAKPVKPDSAPVAALKDAVTGAIASGKTEAITEMPTAEVRWTRELTPVGRAEMLKLAGLNQKRAFVTWNNLTDAERARLIDWNKNPANVITDERPLVQRGGSVETGDAGQTGEPTGAGSQSGGRMGGEQSGGTESTGSTGNAITDSARGDRPGNGSGTEGGGRTRPDAGDERAGDLRTVRGSGSDTGVGEAERLRADIAEDYTLTPEQLPTKFPQVDRYNKNIAAINLMRQITAENRLATEAEKAVLVQYVGWGGIKNAFVAEKEDWRDRFNELKELLTPEEYEAARASIQDAHYTTGGIIGAIWKAFRRFGFTGGKLVEGGSGLLHFWGLMPADMRGKSSYHGVERDHITAKIAALIYPKATIQNMGFEDSVLERDHFDASAGNPPFGNKILFDKNHKEASKHSIHNFFIGKQIELLKEGGVGGWVISHYFLDALDPAARKWIHEQAEFLGAVRLPNTAFKGNANTEVTTDIVFFRKRFKGERVAETADWLNVPKVNGIPMNGYFETHPEMLLGTPSMAGTMHPGREEFTLSPIPGANLTEQLDTAISKLPADVFGARVVEETQRLTKPKVEVADGLKVGSFFEKDGKIMVRTRDINGARQAEEHIPSSKARGERMRGMIALRDLLNTIVRAELGDAPDAALKRMRKALSSKYDEYVKKYGPLNSLGNRQAFNDDTDAARVFALERDYDPGISDKKAKETGVEARKPSAKKADIFERRVNVRHEEVTTAATPADAMWVSLNQRGTVDVPYMAKLTGMSEAKVIDGAGELIYEDPKAGWQYRESYLSGNVREKLAEAKKAAKKDPRFERNVAALEAAMPADIAPMDIRANLGAGWIPADVVQQFIGEVLEGEALPSVVYVPELGRWNVVGKFDSATAATYAVFHSGDKGRVAMGFSELINTLLNSKAIRIYERVDKDTTVFDSQATTAAEEKAAQLRERFRDWLMMDEQRRTRLHRIYNDTMNNFVNPRHTGHHLTLPGLKLGIKLRQHQKSVVARTIAERTVYYDHVVGAGKTFAGIASFMEMKRLGLVKKALFAVPNHLTMQWRDDFVKLYPNANVLYATPADFAKDKRQKLFAKIMTGDWDAVILGHSSLKKLGVAAETEAKMFKEMLDEITGAIEAMRREQKADAGKKVDSRFLSNLEKMKDSVAAKLKKAQDRVGQRDEAVNFEEMGFDGLFVDEAHEFKNLFFTTQMTRVAGMGNPTGSARAFDLYTKLRYMRDRYNGQAPTVFASGTPVSNSLVEMFTVQRYLQPEQLKAMGLTTLDAWAKTFGDVRSVSEVDPSGTGYRMATRFASFQNVGELATLYRTIADVITMDDLKQQAEAEIGEDGKPGRFPVPKVKGGKPENVVVERSQLQHSYFGIENELLDDEGEPQLDSDGVPIVEYNKGSILHRIANMPKDPKIDNMLKVTNDARKSSLDMRLIDPAAPDFEGSKVNRSVADMVRIYKKWNDKKGTQLVFCDLSVPASARGKATKKAKEQATGGVVLMVNGDGYRVVSGAKPVEIDSPHAGLSLFIAKGSYGWDVIEQSTGRLLTRGNKTQKAASEAAKEVLENSSSERMVSFLKENAIPLEVFAQFNDDAAAADATESEDETDELKEDESEDKVSMDELLADSSTFSVYDDIKAKLIASGIPANEIAFIHDYDTPVAKQKLFKAMNAGEIRILLGSTPKLGAGTNVQAKLVALHHLDAPWRPSDLEQREGRIIRQGNEFFNADPDGFEVEIKRYATSQTYDTRMWQLIEHKATGIIQFRNADRSTRDLEDIDGEAANAADMKAAASGDPLIQKEITLRNEVRKLEALRRSHFAADHELTSRVRSLNAAPEYYGDSLRKATRLNEIAESSPRPEKFEAEAIDGGKRTTISKPAELEDAFKASANEGDNAPFAVYRGLTLSVTLRTQKGGVTNILIHAKNGRNTWDNVINYDITETPDVSLSGMFTRIDNFLGEAKENVGYYKGRIADDLKAAAELAPKLGQPFPKEKLLTDKRAEHAETLSALKSNKQKRRIPNNRKEIQTWMDDGGNSTGLFADVPRDTREGFGLFADLPRQTAQIEEEREAILNPDDPNPLKGRSGGQDVRDVFAKVFKGRKDLLDRYAPGAAAAITDGEIDAARYRGAMREMMANLTGELDAVFGETKEGKKRRKAFVAELLPRAARLNPVAYDSKDNFVFADFNMRAGSISEKQADNAGVSTGSPWIGRDGEKLIVGEYLAEQKAYQLLRPMSAALQAALYEDFNRKYPETAHYLERFIAPDMDDARITDSRGFELPEFNRHALRKFFGDVSPFGELGNVEGYVPEVSRTRSLAGILSSAVKNALNRNWQSGAREYKTGDARESGEVRDIFAGFGLRALEAASERERRDTAEKLLAIAVKDIPPGGVVPDGWIAVNPQNMSSLANAYASAHGLDGKKLMEFTNAVAAGDMDALKTLVGQAWALLKKSKMIKAEVVKELVRPLTDRVIRNKFVALVDSLSKSYIGGLLAHPFSWITNITSNELFKLMRIAQRALYGGFIKAAGWVSKDMARAQIQKGGKLALLEAWELTKALLYARSWNKKQIDSVVSPELFEGNTSISGAVRSMTEDQMTAMDFLKQANVPQAILKAVDYSGMDVKAKQAIAYASYMAQAQVAADDAMKKGIRFADKKQRMEWMKNWLTTAPAEVHRRAHATAVAYAMDYENVPWWMDEKSASPAMNIVRRLMFPFIKWPYNMARQMKRFGLDSAIDLAAWTAGRTIGHVPGAIGETMRSWQSSRKASGAKMANSVAHLATFGMMYAAMRALLGAANDDDEVERLGRSFDQAGNRLGREWDTSNRINITDVPILGTAVAALAKMHGDTGENDYWLRVRNVPYAGPMLAMASTMSWLSAGDDASAGRADEAKNAWREFVSDFWSEGILLSSMNAIHGNESKYTAGQPVSVTLGGAFMDLATSRIAPVPVLSAIRDTVDPEMRRLNDSKTLDYAPGFIEGMESRIPGLSDNLPPKGQVKTKLAANAVKDLAKVEHPKAKRIYTNPTTGKTMATYVDPEDKRDIPRWRTLLRIAGANVKPVNRAGYKTAVAGKEQAAAYRKAMRILNDD